jgi:hypothetical protein
MQEHIAALSEADVALILAEPPEPPYRDLPNRAT